MIRNIIITFFFISYVSLADINITTTIKPLADISKHICKDKCKTDYIIPSNNSIHHYEYKISDMKKIYNADIFLYIGVAEPQIDKITSSISKEKLMPVYKMKNIYLIKNFEFGIHNEEDEEHEHHHNLFHPALWLYLDNSIVIARNIADKLISLDSENRDFYKSNLKTFEENVKNLKEKYITKFKKLKNKNFVSYHYTFAYIVKMLDLKYLAVIEQGHGKKPSIKHIINIINLLKKHNIKTVFASKQFFNPIYIKPIKSQINLNIVIVDPIGKEDNYIKMMEILLESIYRGLNK